MVFVSAVTEPIQRHALKGVQKLDEFVEVLENN